MYWTAAPLNFMATKKALLKEGLFVLLFKKACAV